MIVVIPCYKEPELDRTVQSLFDCDRGDFPVEIILLINSYRIDTDEVLAMNRASYRRMKDFSSTHNSPDFCLTPLLIENLPGHQTGAGLPRKLGMDEAIRRFKGDKSGIIVSLDADCTVATNYLTEIYRNFKEYRLHSATIEFHHPVEHLDVSDPLRIAATNYEDYLRYYRQALEFCGYPYPYFTIGSAFAVTAETYLKVGGMGRQQSGEDFYFLQKVFPLGRTRFIDTTCVYPAARISDRVPFGTGPAIQKMLAGNQLSKFTYQVEAFRALKTLFDKVDLFFRKQENEIEESMKDLPDYLLLFLREDGFLRKMEEINQHTASFANFRKRFFHYFNAFKILKYLNFVHPAYFELANVREQSIHLDALVSHGKELLVF
jgi:hypothetical protein